MTESITDEFVAREVVAGLRLDINRNDGRMKNATITFAEAYNQFRQKEVPRE